MAIIKSPTALRRGREVVSMSNVALFLAAGALTAAAANPRDTAFDMECSGTEWTFKATCTDLSCADENSFREHLRIDLNARLWCQQSCGITQPVQSGPGTIAILLERNAGESGTDTVSKPIASLNYDSGDYVEMRRWFDGRILRRHGACQKAPFSGFPGS